MTPNAPIPIIRVAETASTNLDARARIADADMVFWIVAETQSAGRGRDGRAWHSPRGGLWATLAAPLPPEPAGVLDGLGLRIGIALTDAIAAYCPRARLKWPNDVLIDGAKVAGVLTEIVDGWAIVGCGVNVANDPPNLPPPAIATTLRDVVTPAPIPEDVLTELTPRLLGALAREGVSENDARLARELTGDDAVAFPDEA